MATGLTTFLCLNDDCLWSIFSYLKLPEVIVAQKVCKRFKAIAEMYFKRCQVVDFTELAKYYPRNRITYDAAKEIGAVIGSYVTAVKISHKSVQSVRSKSKRTRDCNCNLPVSLLSSFENLKCLFLQSYKITDQCIGKITPCGFKYFQFENCNIHEFIFGRLYSDGLDVLKFNANTIIDGSCFSRYSTDTLDELKIYQSTYFDLYSFELYSEYSPEIRNLTVSIDIGSNDSYRFFESIAKYLKELDMLVIMEILIKKHSPNINYEMIRALPSITKLRVDSLGDERAHKLDVFLESVAKQIECLNIGCKEENLLEVLTHFTKLRVLILKNLMNFQPSTVLSCTETLEELHLINCDAITSDELKELLLKLKTLKLLNLCGCNSINFSILQVIEECLGGRIQKLEIVIMRTPFGKEMKLKRNGQKIREFLVKMKGKIKFTNSGYNLNGTPIQSFHVWDEWKGDQVNC